jgi:hypothetical protein
MTPGSDTCPGASPTAVQSGVVGWRQERTLSAVGCGVRSREPDSAVSAPVRGLAAVVGPGSCGRPQKGGPVDPRGDQNHWKIDGPT